MSNEYIKGLQSNKDLTNGYYAKSVVKTEQQKLLETLLKKNANALKIADVACGGGTLSYHLQALYPNANFFLVDLNEDAISLAKSICTGDNFHFVTDSIYDLKNLSENEFDLLFCWQTLSWIDDPQKVLHQMIRRVKKGGKLYLSSLFNLDHDVDIYAKVKDHTRQGETQYSYNTYSSLSIKEWIGSEVEKINFYPFHPSIDFLYEGRGLGTFTAETDTKRLQFSGGMLLNWAILEIVR